MQGIDSDLIRGHIDTIILKTLFEGDKYGYEICKDVEEKSGGTYELKQPTLYSCLKRLEGQGLISSYWTDSDIGGKRHYYKLTELGKDTFRQNQEDWQRSRQIIDNLISENEKVVYTTVKVDELEDLKEKANKAENSSEQIEQTQAISSGIDFSGDDVIPWSNSIDEDNSDDVQAEEDAIYNADTTDDNNSYVASFAPNGEVSWAYQEQVYENISENAESLDEDDANEVITSPAQANIFEDVDIQQDVETTENIEEQAQTQSESSNYALKEVKENFDRANETEEQSSSAFSFDINDYKIDDNQSYFEAEEEQSFDYVAPSMVIDGLEKKTESIVSINNQEKIEEPASPATSNIVYHNFGAKNNVEEVSLNSKEADEDEIVYIDEQDFDPDKIYLNPELVKQSDEQCKADDDNELDLFADNFLETESNDQTYEQESQEKEISHVDVDFYKPTENYDNMSVNFLDKDYKQKLDSLSDDAANSSQSSAPVLKDYQALAEEFERDGITIRPFVKSVKKPTSSVNRTYVLSNKLNLINAWTSFAIITFMLCLTFIIMNNNSSGFTYDFSGKYFLIGIAVLAVVPIIYTILYFINPYLKKQARYAGRMYTLFAVLLTIQLFIIIYCINLQVGFYSFSQENYNHLLWVIPCLLALYPIVDAIMHTVLFKSKNFHV